MAKEEININSRMLELIDILMNIGEIRFRQNFYDAIELQKQNVRQIKDGRAKFTLSQVEKACRIYNVNANWLMGTEKQIFRKLKVLQKTP